MSSPVFKDNVIYFGGDDGNVYAVDAETGRQDLETRDERPGPRDGRQSWMARFTSAVTTESFTRSMRGQAALKWKVTTEGERRFEAKGLHGLQPKNQTIADPFDVFLSSPVVVNGSVYFGSGDGNLYALDSATGDLRWKFKTGDVVHASPAVADGVLFSEAGDSYFYAVDATTGQ